MKAVVIGILSKFADLLDFNMRARICIIRAMVVVESCVKFHEHIHQSRISYLQ